MKYADPEAFRAALETRLREGSNSAQDLSRRRRIVAFDRLLARLAVSEIPDRGLVVRLSVDALLGSRVFESIVVDVVAGEGMPATAESVELGRAERVRGIEPPLSAWEAEVLPLNYTRRRRPEPIQCRCDRGVQSGAWPLGSPDDGCGKR